MTTEADAVYAQHEALYGTDPDEQPGLRHDWQAARRSHRMASPFWRMWLGSPPMPCDQCGTPIRLDRFEAIR